jgi:hypothetical protein
LCTEIAYIDDWILSQFQTQHFESHIGDETNDTVNNICIRGEYKRIMLAAVLYTGDRTPFGRETRIFVVITRMYEDEWEESRSQNRDEYTP